jgi:Fibrinogen beta and gamma chains, C-terminal globular domain
MNKPFAFQFDWNRPWTDYKHGFTSSSGYWLGLEAVHQLTTFNSYRLLIAFFCTDGMQHVVEYGSFKIGDEMSTNYTINISRFALCQSRISYKNVGDMRTETQ